MASPRRVLVICSESHFGLRFVAGIHAFFSTHGNWEYHVERDRGPGVIERCRFAVRHWKADGVIAKVRSLPMKDFVLGIRAPVVHLGGIYKLNLPTVGADDMAVGREAARHFLNNGARNFAYCGKGIEESSRLSCAGFVEELARAGYGCSVLPEQGAGYPRHEWAKNRQRIATWLLSLQKPVAILCAHDWQGQEVSIVCRRLGIRVPDDVALVAMGNQDILCRMCAPPLSSIEINCEQIGYESARLLHQILRTGARPSKPVLVPPVRVVTRQSSDSIAIEDPDIAAAVRYIRDHAHEQIGVKDLLGEIPISRRALEGRFERRIGRTPRAEILRVRMERAKHLLEQSTLSISAIAKSCGFAGPEIFCVCFRRYTGRTPTNHRRRSLLNPSVSSTR